MFPLKSVYLKGQTFRRHVLHCVLHYLGMVGKGRPISIFVKYRQEVLVIYCLNVIDILR